MFLKVGLGYNPMFGLVRVGWIDVTKKKNCQPTNQIKFSIFQKFNLIKKKNLIKLNLYSLS